MKKEEDVSVGETERSWRRKNSIRRRRGMIGGGGIRREKTTPLRVARDSRRIDVEE